MVVLRSVSGAFCGDNSVGFFLKRDYMATLTQRAEKLSEWVSSGVLSEESDYAEESFSFGNAFPHV